VSSTHPFSVAVFVLSVRAMQVLRIQSNHRDAENHLDEAKEGMHKVPRTGFVERFEHDGDEFCDRNVSLEEE
jgi:hypothetical protein